MFCLGHFLEFFKRCKTKVDLFWLLKSRGKTTIGRSVKDVENEWFLESQGVSSKVFKDQLGFALAVFGTGDHRLVS